MRVSHAMVFAAGVNLGQIFGWSLHERSYDVLISALVCVCSLLWARHEARRESHVDRNVGN